MKKKGKKKEKSNLLLIIAFLLMTPTTKHAFYPLFLEEKLVIWLEWLEAISLQMVRINITNWDWFCSLICWRLESILLILIDFVLWFAMIWSPKCAAIMTNSFLILLITIKVEIALILQGVSINTHSVMTKKREKKILYTSLILPDHHSHIHTPFFISLLKKTYRRR